MGKIILGTFIVVCLPFLGMGLWYFTTSLSLKLQMKRDERDHKRFVQSEERTKILTQGLAENNETPSQTNVIVFPKMRD